MHNFTFRHCTLLIQSTAIILAFIFSFNSYAYDECITINSDLVEQICYENLGDHRTDNDSKQGGFSPSQLPQDITDYAIYFHLVDPEKVQEIRITDPNYKLSYDNALDGQTLYLQDNRRHHITFNFKGEDYERPILNPICIVQNVWTISWVFVNHFWGFFSDPVGTWTAVWKKIEIKQCMWKTTWETHEEQHSISIDVPINVAHATEAVSIELDNKHVGEQPRFRVKTTYPHAVEGTVTLSTIADESSERTDIHKERLVLSSENDHYLAPVSLDKDHVAENITTTAIVRVENDKQDINIHSDVINHHRRLQKIQLINSLDDRTSNCQHSTLSVLRAQDEYCLLQSSALSEASNDFYNMVIQPEQQARYGNWDNTGDMTVVKARVPINSIAPDNRDELPPRTNRYHVYDNGLASCKITDDLNQRDFPALSCHVDNYASHSLQIDYDHRQQNFDAYLVTAKGKKPLTDTELDSLPHNNWQDWIVGNPLDTFPRESYTIVPSNTADKRIFPVDYTLSALFPDDSQYIPIGQARYATADIDVVTSFFESFSFSYLLYPTIQDIENLSVWKIYQMKQDRSIEWRDLDRFITVSEEDAKALSSETKGLGQWRLQLVRQGGDCDKRWEDYINSPYYETHINDCLEYANAMYLALLKIAISDYYLRSREDIRPAQNVITILNNKFNSLVVYLRLHYIQQAFQNQDVSLLDFVQSEFAQYGEYNQQAHGALLNACLSNALCSQLIFNVQHYESLIRNLSDKHHQRTGNIDQKLSPILSGNGLTEFLLALESWQVWDKYQRTLDRGDSQFIVTDNLDGSHSIKFTMPENTDEPSVLDIAIQHPLHDFAKKLFQHALTQQEQQLFLNSLSDISAIDNFQKQLTDCGDNLQCVDTAFAEFEGTRPQPSVMDQLGQELDDCNQDDDCVVQALNRANNLMQSYMFGNAGQMINSLGECQAEHLESEDDQIYRQCILNHAIELYPDVDSVEIANGFAAAERLKQCLNNPARPKTKQSIEDCIRNQTSGELTDNLVTFMHESASYLERKQQQYTDVLSNHLSDPCLLSEADDDNNLFKSAINFIIPRAHAVDEEDEEQTDLCDRIDALQMVLRLAVELEGLEIEINDDDIQTLLNLLSPIFRLPAYNLELLIGEILSQSPRSLERKINNESIGNIDAVIFSILSFTRQQINMANSNNNRDLKNQLKEAMSEYWRDFKRRAWNQRNNQNIKNRLAFLEPYLLVDGFDELATLFFSHLIKSHGTQQNLALAMTGWVAFQAILEITVDRSIGGFTPMAMAVGLLAHANNPLGASGADFANGAWAYLFAAVAFSSGNLYDVVRDGCMALKQISQSQASPYCFRVSRAMLSSFFVLPYSVLAGTYIYALTLPNDDTTTSQELQNDLRNSPMGWYTYASKLVLPANVIRRYFAYGRGWEQQDSFNEGLNGIGSLDDIETALDQFYREERQPTSIWFPSRVGANFNPSGYELRLRGNNGTERAFHLPLLVDYIEALHARRTGQQITINHPLRLERIDVGGGVFRFRITDDVTVNLLIDGFSNYLRAVAESFALGNIDENSVALINTTLEENKVSIEIIDPNTNGQRVVHLPLVEADLAAGTHYLTGETSDEEIQTIQFGTRYKVRKRKCSKFLDYFNFLGTPRRLINWLGTTCRLLEDKEYKFGSPEGQLVEHQVMAGHIPYWGFDPSIYSEYRIVDGNMIQGRLENSIEWDYITDIDPNSELDPVIPAGPQPLSQLACVTLIANFPTTDGNLSALTALRDNVILTRPLENGNSVVSRLRNWLISENPPQGGRYVYRFRKIGGQIVLGRELHDQIGEWESFDDGGQLEDFYRGQYPGYVTKGFLIQIIRDYFNLD